MPPQSFYVTELQTNPIQLPLQMALIQKAYKTFTQKVLRLSISVVYLPPKQRGIEQ